MLQSLTVENYALIDHLQIDLAGDLNIITGETGAGKSILLGALGLLLGGKNDGAATKDNTKNCVVEGRFLVTGLGLEALFELYDWEYDDEVIIRRVITPSGKSRSFVGDVPASLSDLKTLSSRLINIHSQHQNQTLASEEFRVVTIDQLWENSQSLHDSYTSEYQRLGELKQELRQFEEAAARAKRDEEWLTYQVEELTAAQLKAGEDEEAEAELLVLENAEQIGETLGLFLQRMDGDDEGGVLLAIRNSERELIQIGKSYPSAAEYAERLGSVLAELKDMASSVGAERERVDADPERLERLNARVDMIYSLCQKHRAKDLSELLEVRDRYIEQLGTIVGADEQIGALKRSIEECEKSARNIARKIGAKRRAVAPKFAKEIVALLGRLGMDGAQFRVEITEGNTLMESGLDAIEFLFTSVASKTPQPIASIASGGEISRVMLSLKAILARYVSLPTIIFDEIDTGVSGRIADAMGEIIAELSKSMQVIDITHLPQVASKGESHFVVYKEGGKTNITKLTAAQRIDQIATMISGSRVTEAARTQAKELLGS